MHYGKRMKEIMQEMKITQEELSRRTKLKQQNISLIFRNESPTMRNVEKICKGLGISMAELEYSKSEIAEKFAVPDNLSTYVIFLKNQKPEIQELLKDIAFKISNVFGDQVTP